PPPPSLQRAPLRERKEEAPAAEREGAESRPSRRLRRLFSRRDWLLRLDVSRRSRLIPPLAISNCSGGDASSGEDAADAVQRDQRSGAFAATRPRPDVAWSSRALRSTCRSQSRRTLSSRRRSVRCKQANAEDSSWRRRRASRSARALALLASAARRG